LTLGIIVIGGGAAGMMAACAAAECGASVTVLERNDRTLLKLGITGKGRCNVTNDCDIDTLMKNIAKNGRFLYGAFNRFDTAQAMEFFESAGVPLKTERGGRVFPESDRALDVVAAMRSKARNLGVKIVTAKAESILTENGAVCGVRASGRNYKADSVILATGGMSYPKTGSDGSGYKLAEMLGHTIVEPMASLVPLNADDKCAKMQGLSLKNTKVWLLKDGKRIYEDFGEMMFTHFGVTGPVILSASAHMRDETSKYTLELDLKPALDEKTLDARLLRDFTEFANLDISNYMPKLLPRLMAEYFVDALNLADDRKVNTITREERKNIIKLLKKFEIEIISKRDISEAVITSGGVSVKEIDPKTMESKLIPGLYFAGEIIDVDAYTGGFNLQIAWSTGHLSGVTAAY